MGQAILYCYRCSTQLRESHFERGNAFRIDTRACCAECAPEAVRTLPPDLVQSLLVQLKARAQSGTPSTRKITQRKIASAAHATSSAGSRSPGSWVAASAVAVVLSVVAVVFFSSGSSPSVVESTRAPQPVPPPMNPPPPRRPSDAAEAASAQSDPPHLALKAAREYAR
ncbi:MAG TPA: hypothetical protein VKW04_05960, partial [Planctomycetota bacterium]|nr:hypothetical protein [Planctomycetota bacterium]